MDDLAPPTARDDLASIVLGTSRAPERQLDAPERVPVWGDVLEQRRTGFDARSVIVLALVVGVLAAMVGWATNVHDEAPGSTATAGDAFSTVGRDAGDGPDAALGDAVGAAASAAERTVDAAASAPAAGPNLAAARLVATRSGSGTGLVRVAVKNTGDAPIPADRAEVLVLADGDVVGSAPIGQLAPAASTSVEVSLGWCPAGAVALVAVLDSGSALREADERDNSISRSASFGC